MVSDLRQFQININFELLIIIIYYIIYLFINIICLIFILSILHQSACEMLHLRMLPFYLIWLSWPSHDGANKFSSTWN